MTIAPNFSFDRGQEVGPVAQGEEIFDLAGLVLAVWRKKLLVTAAAIFGATLALVWVTQMVSPVFHSTAVLVMEATPEPAVDLETFVPGLGAENSAINTEIEVISSRALLSRLVSEMNLVNDPEFNPELRVAFFEPVLERLRVFGLWPHALPVPSDIRAALTQTATIDQLYQKVSVRNVPDSLVFEVTVESRDRKKAANLANTLSDLYIQRQLELKYSSNETAVAWLSRRAAELGAELEVAEKKANGFAAQMQIINPDTVEALQMKLIEVRDRISALLQAQDRSSSGSGYESQLERLREQEQLISKKILQQSQDIIALNQLQREAESSRVVYESFLGRLKETSVQQGIQQADSVVLSRAEVAQFPANPRPALSMMVGMFLFAAGAVLVILYREIGRMSFRTVEELSSSFPVPVLGQIRQLPSTRRKAVVSAFEKTPGLAALEDIRSLRASFVSTPPDDRRVTLFTSSLPGEGKTTHALLFTQALGELGKKVLLIEADLRRPTLGSYFRFKASDDSPGLQDVMRGEISLKAALLKPKGSSYYMLRAGARSDENPASLLSKPGFSALLDEAQDLFDHVIVDSPPVLSVPDAKVIAPHASTILYVVRWGRTTESEVRRGLSTFASVGSAVDGLLLTRVDSRTMARLGTTEYKSAY